jgi:NAD(P)-dependent dehydrogenase (short-subunit alcohol dehydrogenase family)
MADHNKIDLGGRIAVVTGGAQGIGRAIVERFLDSGATVAIWDRDLALRRRPPRSCRAAARQLPSPPMSATTPTSSVRATRR